MSPRQIALILLFATTPALADLESDIQAARAKFDWAMGQFSQGEREAGSGDAAAACTSFNSAEQAFSSVQGDLIELAQRAQIGASLDLRSIAIDAGQNARAAGINAAQLCNASPAPAAEPEYETRWVTREVTYHVLSPTMETARERAVTLTNLLTEPNRAVLDQCRTVEEARLAVIDYRDMIDPRIAETRANTEIPAEVRDSSIAALEEQRQYWTTRLGEVQDTIDSNRAACAEAARLAAAPPPPRPQPAPSPPTPDAATVCEFADRQAGSADADLTIKAYMACASMSKAGSFAAVNARTQLARLYQAAGKTAELAPLLEELTSDPVASLPYFHHKPSGVGGITIGDPATGITQAELLYARAQLRIGAQEYAAAVPLLERAIKASRQTPDDERKLEGECFAVRAYVRGTANRSDEAVSDILRAYVRGSENGIVTENVGKFDANQKAALAALRDRHARAAAALEAAAAPTCAIRPDIPDCAGARAEAAAAITAIEQEEEKLFGPLTWDAG